MRPFTVLKGVAAPLMKRDVDTDVIIRIERLITVEKKDLGPYAFEAWRYLPDGSENPEFLLNRPPWRDTKILLNGVNFGCGSSREGAVWAIEGFGIRCVIAPSFGDIFYGNCFQNGILPIVLPLETIEEMAEQARQTQGGEFAIDLTTNEITTPTGAKVAFSVDPGRRQMLLEGLDEVGMTLKRESEIAAFRARDRAERPWIYDMESA